MEVIKVRDIILMWTHNISQKFLTQLGKESKLNRSMKKRCWHIYQTSVVNSGRNSGVSLVTQCETTVTGLITYVLVPKLLCHGTAGENNRPIT